MKYKNPRAKGKKRVRPLEVSCASCKTPVAIYQKAGKGGLIKMQFHRILEAEIDLDQAEGSFDCPNCGNSIARKGDYMGRPAYWIIRGQINTRWLKDYKI